MSLDHAAQSGQHAYAERGHDCYSTPPCAVEALLRVEQLPPTIWEPAAGYGGIVATLRDAGHAVVASDIVAYNGLNFVADFLVVKQAPADVGAIITNPPYRLAEQFVAHALTLAPTVVMLLRLAFIESARRTDILEHRGLARVHVFRNRLPMMHRDGWQGPRASSAIPFAWFVWNRNHSGPTIIDRISAQAE